MNELEFELNHLYSVFFKKLEINSITGILKNTNKRFATKVAIGKNYPISKKRILFISLDIGADENSENNTFQDFDERRDSVCNSNLTNKNPHMAGVYGTALYFLRNEYNWEKSWELLENQNQFFREALLSNHKELPGEVLTHISLLNFYNFVTVGRDRRTGGNDRVFLNAKEEIQLLIDTINCLNPNIIIVQSTVLRNYFKTLIKNHINQNCEIYVGYHPSIFGRGIKYRRPKEYIKNLLEKGRL